MTRLGRYSLVGVLLTGILLSGWLSSRAMAAALSWDEASYDQLAPADTTETIPPGTTINMSNWQKYKKFMPVGMWSLWDGSQYYKLPPDAEIQTIANVSIPLPKKYQQDTEKYSSQVSPEAELVRRAGRKGLHGGAAVPESQRAQCRNGNCLQRVLCLYTSRNYYVHPSRFHDGPIRQQVGKRSA